MRVRTRQDLHKYILGMLGEGVIEVELTEFQIDSNIDFAIEKFSTFALYGTLKDVLLVDLPKGAKEIILDEKISEVVHLRTQSSGGGFMGMLVPGGLAITPSEIQASIFGGSGTGIASSDQVMLNVSTILSKISALDTLFTVVPHYSFNPFTHTLKFFEEVPSSKILLDVRYHYEPKDEDKIYNHPWVKEYALNLCKRTWGNNIGKYTTQLVGGATLNFERIIQEASTELERLDGELIDKYSAPLPIIKG